MSLVHDALEKAKREASAKTARELGLHESRAATGQPFRSRRRLHPWMMGATVAALAIGALGGFLARSKGGEEPAPVARREAVLQAATTAASPEAPAPELQAGASGTPLEERSPPETAVATQPSPPPTSPTATESAPEATTGSTPPEVRAAPVAPTAPSRTEPPGARSAPPATNGSKRTPTYVRQYTLPDGTVVRLGGIAWSDAAPLAYLNGKLYAKGESVEGLTIEAIEKDRVVLAGASGRIALTLR